MKLAYASVRVLAMLGAGAMLAPAATAQDNTDPTTTSPDSPVANADVTEGTTIVVTAQGRRQQLADVPVAISAVTAETLENSGTNDIRDLTQIAPSLLVSSTGNEANGSARIRGIGTVGDNAGLESSVPVFVDGVYRSRSGNALSELGPLDRVEVLRGPQGTLGGRNSSAGLISIYTAPPEFDFSGYGVASYGNYDALRLEAGVNAPLSDTIAARVDGVYFRRDGFYYDTVNDTDINNRDRYLVRAQALFEPSSDLSFRVVADYSKKDEACCAATFVQPSFAPLARLADDIPPISAEAKFDYPGRPTPALTSRSNPIIPVLLGLGQNPAALNQSTFNRNLYITPGRSYDGETEDYGISGELDWSFGDVTLTSITGYREYSNFQGSDTDYTQVDLLYRAPGENAGARAFKTFTQEVRLNGSLFDDRLDWLVGGYYANEKLEARDSLRFGTQYGAFAPCRIVNAINPALASPAASGCITPQARAVLPVLAPALAPVLPLIYAGLDNLARVNDLGSTGDVYNQESDNFAVFTHNIVRLAEGLDLTLGVRYTNETKKFDATFGNDNTICPTNRALLSPLLGTGAGALAGGIISLSCQGNSTSELNGVSLSDERSEDEFTGTAILSYKVTPDLLLYGSYSRGYKAGGFNLDRSALSIPAAGNPAVVGTTANLQFGAEKVNAYEVGAKYATRQFSLSLTGFRSEFSNFQLNTFNGSVFLVQNINGCDTDLGGADRDGSATTGRCDPDDVKAGVISQGFEFEATASPISDVTGTLGLTYAQTKFEDNLVGNNTGAPLDPALRLLPGDNMSNAPELTVTTSLGYTPPIGDTGMDALFFVNARMVSDYNTGSDLLYGKEQDGYVIVNGRIGITNIADRFSIEGWVQNAFDVDYTQVAFNTPFVAEQQTYSAFLAEPRTYGVTVRAKF
ncbi:TonB-dependent receptor [Qipengyuania sp.]|uniref:TonB-dependent receptor n=1 Tax=Qipengyuania sp. TaxID=2004515 RepID=UPI0035C83C20